MPQVLLTFVGFHDPYHASAIEGEELKGPILYLLHLRHFDRVYLFTGPGTRSHADATAAAIRNALVRTEPRIVDIELDDPISYGQIISGVRAGFRRIAEECPHDGFDLQAFLDEVRRRLFSRALEIANGRPGAAARLLNVTPQAVSNFIRRAGARLNAGTNDATNSGDRAARANHAAD